MGQLWLDRHALDQGLQHGSPASPEHMRGNVTELDIGLLVTNAGQSCSRKMNSAGPGVANFSTPPCSNSARLAVGPKESEDGRDVAAGAIAVCCGTRPECHPEGQVHQWRCGALRQC